LRTPFAMRLCSRFHALLELGEEGGHVGRVVLQVGVERHDGPPARGPEPGGERGRLTGALRERDDAQLRVVPPQPLEHLERPVGRPVVHGHDLVTPALPPDGAGDLVDQEREIVALVIHRDDERDLNQHSIGHTSIRKQRDSRRRGRAASARREGSRSERYRRTPIGAS